MKKYILLISILLLTACKSESLKEIKKYPIERCDEYTIEEVLKESLQNYAWNIKEDLYTVNGEIIYENKISDIKIELMKKKNILEIEKIKLDNERVDQKEITKYMCTKTKFKKRNSKKVIEDIKITTYYNSREYTVEGIPESVTLTIYGSKKDLEMLEDTSNYLIYLDLSEEGEVKNKIYNFQLNLPYDNLIYEINPPTAKINIISKE